jgi:hypothetical protein
VKIAFIALPEQENPVIAPPLPLTYMAALLEQQRHIVRIYDLALRGTLPIEIALAPLRAFRPHIIVVATDQDATGVIQAALAVCDAPILRLGTALREPAPGHAVAQALWQIDERIQSADEQSVIFGALLALDDDLDALPFPARHLLALEQYPLFTPAGELQTTVLAGQQIGRNTIIMRRPSLVVAELRSITREHGIRHFVFPDPPLTHDLVWLNDLLYHLATSDLGISWEGSVRHECLTPELLGMCRQAGCEVLCFEFDVREVLDSKSARAALSTAVEQAHRLGINVRAHIQLQPPYGAVPALVDMSATFGLDTVRFSAQRPTIPHPQVANDGLALEDVAEMARSRYRSSRSRQFFIERFGAQLGPMLWRVGRAGLLGRTWQRYADGGEDATGLIAGSYGG